MRVFTFFILFFFITISWAKNDVKIYHEKTDSGFNIYIDNNEFCPLSVKLNFTLENMRVKNGNNKIYVVRPNEKKQLVTKLTLDKKGKAYKFSIKYWTKFGNYLLESYDKNFEYHLPFKASESFKLYQGYNGSISHQNINALDFTMSIGTEITAIRSGIVIKVVQTNNKSCEQEECAKFNNLIIVYHADGTFAEYLHIMQSGSKVKVGEKIHQDQVIALSGNVGWSTGPHLHIAVFLQKFNDKKTLRTKFLIGRDEKAKFLTEKKVYPKNN